MKRRYIGNRKIYVDELKRQIKPGEVVELDDFSVFGNERS